jgi:hypothetical protein
MPERLTEERIARNEATFRQANERIAEAAEGLEVQSLVPFICECANPACRELLSLSLDAYRAVREDPRRFLNAPGHHQAALGAAKVVERRDGYEVVEKVGHAGEVAEQIERDGGVSVRERRAD